MDIEKRNEIQRKWKNNEFPVIVATIAFGMGVDKPDVRFVIHMSLPKSLDNYIQECGRAGRDGLPSHVICFYDYSDRGTIDYFNKTSEYASSEREYENKLSLYKILDYVEDRYTCRRVKQLEYLNEKFNPKNCGKM